MEKIDELLKVLSPKHKELQDNINKRYIKHIAYQKIKSLNNFFDVEYDILQKFYPDLKEEEIFGMISKYLSQYNLFLLYIIYFNYIEDYKTIETIVKVMDFEKKYMFDNFELYIDRKTYNKLVNYVDKKEFTFIGLVSTEYKTDITKMDGVKRLLR
jgi:hypothetical protein